MGTDMKKGSGLKYIPINDFNLIPRYLIDQVKPKDWETDRLYKFGPTITASPFTLLGVFVDNDSMVQGFMWSTVNPLDEKIHTHILSVSKEYQRKGIAGEARNILKKTQKKLNLKGILFQTTRHKAFERLGWENTGMVTMEG